MLPVIITFNIHNWCKLKHITHKEYYNMYKIQRVNRTLTVSNENTHQMHEVSQYLQIQRNVKKSA
jgi:hypothetical protein